MWEADQAWRDRLRSARLSDLLEMLQQDIPVDLLKRTGAWISERS
jgi:hypothetical protein